MAEKIYTYTVFTKPWRMPLPDLAKFISGMGFDGIELPVRDGFQVEPANVTKGLPQAVRILADHGLKIASIAGPTDEKTMAACAESGVPIIRICVGMPYGAYMAAEAALIREYDALVPLLDKYGVILGIQNHCDACIANAMGLRHLLERYNPKHIAAVWDAAHNALNGEDPEIALDIVWSHLCMVNLKNAFWLRKNGPEAAYAEWTHYWTSGRHGLASWPRVAAELKRRDYRGVLCLTAEYSDTASVNRLILEDLTFAKSLFA